MKRIAWFVFVAALFIPSPCLAQYRVDESKPAPEALKTDVYITSGVVIGSATNNDVYYYYDPNWEKRFLPARPATRSWETIATSHGELFLGIEPVVSVWLLRFGVPLGYQVNSRDMGWMQYYWWDPVVLRDIDINRTGFSYGYSFAVWRIQLEQRWRGYTMFFQDYEGVDCIGCRNSSKKYGPAYAVSEGKTIRSTLSFLFPYGIGAGFYLEPFHDMNLQTGMGVVIKYQAGIFHRTKTSK